MIIAYQQTVSLNDSDQNGILQMKRQSKLNKMHNSNPRFQQIMD